MKKSLFFTCIISVLMIISICLVSCGQTFSQAYSADEIATAAMNAVTGIAADGFTEMKENYVNVFMGVDTAASTFCIMHTVSSASYDELGVFKCNSEEDAKALLDVINNYLAVSKEENVPVAQSYAPNEVPKLENACAKRFGVYVTYAVLADEQRDAWFSAVENYLS